MSDIRYRKISVQIWNDERVERLSDDAKLGFIFVLTHPLMTGIGAARLSIPGLSAERGWDSKKGEKAFGEAFREGLLEYDEKRCLLWAPNFLKHNKPESPNVVKSWQWIPVTLPDCPLKYKIFQSVKAFTEGLSEDFAKALPEVFREGYRESKNIEQRTESTEQRSQKREKKETAPPMTLESFRAWKATPEGQAHFVELSNRKVSAIDDRLKYPSVVIFQQIPKMEDWIQDNPEKAAKRTNLPAFTRNWMERWWEDQEKRKAQPTGFTTPLSDRQYDETKRRTGSTSGGFTKIGEVVK